jgi:Transmembrane domain of unknown function (DUF3566)
VGFRGRIRRGVRVRRVVRRVELWSVAKIGLFLHVFCGLLTLAVGTGLWFVAEKFGLISKFESLMGDLLATDNFQIHGDVLFKGAVAVVSFFVVVNLISTILIAFLYNMLSGFIGGLVFSVLQEVPRPGTVAAELQAQALGTRPEPTRKERKAAEKQAKSTNRQKRERVKQAEVAQTRVRRAKATRTSPVPVPANTDLSQRTDDTTTIATGANGAHNGSAHSEPGTNGDANGGPTGVSASARANGWPDDETGNLESVKNGWGVDEAEASWPAES